MRKTLSGALCLINRLLFYSLTIRLSMLIHFLMIELYIVIIFPKIVCERTKR